LLLSLFLFSHCDKKNTPPFTEEEEQALNPADDVDEIRFTVAYTIKTSYCFEAETQSGFEIWAGTLDLYGQLLWLGKLTRDSCRIHQKYETRFEGQAIFVASLMDVLECIQGGNTDSCDPRGEVVFIDMREEFVDDWSIEMVTVNSIFEYDLQTYNTSFEHSILDPCKTRMDEPAIYQIGPSSGRRRGGREGEEMEGRGEIAGQMVKLKKMPQVMDWISHRSE
ncbi:hypothetical protein PMAYCL1PPCAC_18649, partial [Pristionchus mayeri]